MLKIYWIIEAYCPQYSTYYYGMRYVHVHVLYMGMCTRIYKV